MRMVVAIRAWVTNNKIMQRFLVKSPFFSWNGKNRKKRWVCNASDTKAGRDHLQNFSFVSWCCKTIDDYVQILDIILLLGQLFLRELSPSKVGIWNSSKLIFEVIVMHRTYNSLLLKEKQGKHWQWNHAKLDLGSGPRRISNNPCWKVFFWEQFQRNIVVGLDNHDQSNVASICVDKCWVGILITNITNNSRSSRREGIGDKNGAVDCLKVTHFVNANNGTNCGRSSNMAFKILSHPFDPIQNKRIWSCLRIKPIMWYNYSRNRLMLEEEYFN